MPPAWPLPVTAVTAAACGSALWRRAGAHGVTVFVKATFGLVNESAARLVAPVDLVREDRFRGHSLEAASETAPYLPSAGVVLTGHAHAPAGRPAPALSVRLCVFRERSLLDKTLHVLGFRAPNTPQKPWPFQDVPIVYERAYGGPGFDDNPVGTGAAPGSPLPNVVDPADARRPAGFGPIARRWAARQRLLVGVDPAALDRSVAEIPDGFDWRYFHAAPADQQIELLRGDEWIVLDGMHSTLPRVQSRLPSPRAEVRWHLVGPAGAGPGRPVELHADTLVIDAAAQTASVVWRGHVLLDHVDKAASAGDPRIVLARMRVFAGVELPGYPIPWPKPEEIAAAAPAAPPGGPASWRKPDIRVADFDTESTTHQVTMPRGDEGRAPSHDAELQSKLGSTGRIDLRKANEPSLPFRKAAAGELPHFEEAKPRPPSIGLGSTALDARSPFASASVLPFKQDPPPAPPPVEARASLPDLVETGDDPQLETRAIDIRALTALSNQLAPFGLAAPGQPSARPEAPRTAIPGAPWSQPPQAPPAASPPQFVPSAASDPTPVAFFSGAAPPPPVAAPPMSPWAGGGGAPSFLAAPAMSAPPTFGERAASSLSIGEQLATPATFGDHTATPSHAGDSVAPPLMMINAPPPMVSAPPPMVPAPAPVASAPPQMLAAPPQILAAPPPMLAAPPAMLSAPPPITAPPAPLTTTDDEAPRPATSPLKAILPTIKAASPGVREKVIAALAAREPLDGLDLAGADLSDLDLSGRSFAGQSLRGAILCRSNLAKASLVGAQLIDADLSEAVLTGADLGKADLSRATLARAQLGGAQLGEANLTGARGPGANLAGAQGERTVFAKGTWSGASFDGASLLTADFSGATLEGTTFRGAMLRSIRLDGARGAGAIFDGAKMLSASAEGVELAKASLTRVEAEGSNWDRATLSGSSWAGAKLKGASLNRATVDRADFSGADLAEAKAQRMSGEGVELSCANLEGADLRRATLPDASLTEATFSRGLADKADLSRARLTRADLRGASLRGANLKGAILAHAQLEGADLRDVDLEQANLFQADRKSAKMAGANLKDVREVEPDPA